MPNSEPFHENLNSPEEKVKALERLIDMLSKDLDEANHRIIELELEVANFRKNSIP